MAFHSGWKGLPVRSLALLKGWSVCMLPYLHIDSLVSDQTDKSKTHWRSYHLILCFKCCCVVCSSVHALLLLLSIILSLSKSYIFHSVRMVMILAFCTWGCYRCVTFSVCLASVTLVSPRIESLYRRCVNFFLYCSFLSAIFGPCIHFSLQIVRLFLYHPCECLSDVCLARRWIWLSSS